MDTEHRINIAKDEAGKVLLLDVTPAVEGYKSNRKKPRYYFYGRTLANMFSSMVTPNMESLPEAQRRQLEQERTDPLKYINRLYIHRGVVFNGIPDVELIDMAIATQRSPLSRTTVGKKLIDHVIRRFEGQTTGPVLTPKQVVYQRT